jgi:hypothetical protein
MYFNIKERADSTIFFKTYCKIKDEEIPILSEEVVLLIERNSKLLSSNLLSAGFKLKR